MTEEQIDDVKEKNAEGQPDSGAEEEATKEAPDQPYFYPGSFPGHSEMGGRPRIQGYWRIPKINNFVIAGLISLGALGAGIGIGYAAFSSSPPPRQFPPIQRSLTFGPSGGFKSTTQTSQNPKGGFSFGPQGGSRSTTQAGQGGRGQIHYYLPKVPQT